MQSSRVVAAFLLVALALALVQSEQIEILDNAAQQPVQNYSPKLKINSFDGFSWFNEPTSFILGNNGTTLSVVTSPESDYWRKTYYGFVRDSGNFFFTRLPVATNFTATVSFDGDYVEQYDQAGIMIRYNEKVWLKTGIEFFNKEKHISAVYTNSYSDWSVLGMDSLKEAHAEKETALTIRVKRSAEAVSVEYSLDGKKFTMFRLGYLINNDSEVSEVMVGVVAASPTNKKGFTARFFDFKLEEGTPEITA